MPQELGSVVTGKPPKGKRISLHVRSHTESDIQPLHYTPKLDETDTMLPKEFR